MMKFLLLKELHRLPPLPQDQTSAQGRYPTATTTAAQRLRAVGHCGRRRLAIYTYGFQFFNRHIV
ncbi:hypothetical protein SPHINGOT1_440001 [Sphingomonas sp. T1]|uniref:hypothetical protein n=1 Tax=Sphingomonas sp. T1 TaxID=2653172 RepID=UPI0012F27CA9